MPARSTSSLDGPAASSAQAGVLGDALVRHYDDLVGYVRGRFSLGEMANDVVHDAFVQVSTRPASKPIQSPLGLLRRMLHNLAVDTLRRNDARAAHEVCGDAAEALAAAATCTAPRPDQIIAGREELQLLIAAIHALPPRCQEVFILHKIHGMPLAEVAALLQVSQQAVEKHVRRGMQGCAQHLERHSHV